MDIHESFNKNTKVKKTKDGYSVKCLKGLWGVFASTEEEALNEARHYFRQYYEDGEYGDNTHG